MNWLYVIGGGVLVLVIVVIGIVIAMKKSSSSYEVIDEGSNKKTKISKVTKDKKKKRKKEKKVKMDDVNKHGLTNYNEYTLSFQERIIWTMIPMVIVFTGGYIIYKSYIWAGVLSLVGLLYPKFQRKIIIEKRKKELLLEFKEALYIISASIGAGQSVPIAFKSAYNDLNLIFSHKKKSYILEEFLYINRRIDMNETIEDALMDFANRSGLDDIKMFAEIFYTCNRLGGNLKNVISTTSNMISDKITIKQDIETVISGKKFESKILILIPFAIVVFIDVSSPEFLASLSTFTGRIVGTVALVIIAVAGFWANKITNIEV